MKQKEKSKNFLILGLLLFGITLFLWNCTLDENVAEPQRLDLSNVKTVSFKDAIAHFNSKKEKIKQKRAYAKDTNNKIKITPDWNSLEYNEIAYTNAQLTTANSEINRNGKYSSQLYFINVNNHIRNLIFTIWKEEVDSDGNIINGRIYFNDLEGKFIDGYRIEKGVFTKRFVIKTQYQKASFLPLFLLFQEGGDCWNTDTLKYFEGGVLDEVVIVASGSNSGGGGGGDIYYSTGATGYGNYINGATSSGMNPNGGGTSLSNGQVTSAAAAILMAAPVDPDENGNCPDGYKKNLATGKCESICTGGKYYNTTTEKCECPEGMTIEEYLNIQLEIDPFKLLEIDCNQIENWQSLAQHNAPQSVLDKVQDLKDNHEALLGDWDIQYLNDAGGTIVNMDYFAVNITTLPNNPTTGQQFTANEFLDYFRRNINDFVDGTTFEPYCEISAICQQETDLWNSNNPLGSIIKLDIPINDGVVVCAEYTNEYWRFMTMEAPFDNSHPVSGTRQFGIEQNTNGSHNIYVRGVDRFTSNLQENVSYAISLGNPFFGADNLWESFQEKTKNFVNQNDGGSTTVTPVHNRPDWNKVKDVLEGRRPISDLGCN